MTKKNLTTTIILAVLAGLGILGYSLGSKWYDEKYGEYTHWRLTDDLTAVKYNNGEIGVQNNSTKAILGRYDDVLPSYYNSLDATVLVVIKDNLRGYISAKTGEVIFEPQFRAAWIDDIESGLAACVNKYGKLGFVNVKTKETAIPFQFDYDKNSFTGHSYYRDGGFPIFDFVFHNGICIVPGKDGKIGMIDKTGKMLLPTEYLDIINWRDANTSNIILKRKPFFVGIGISTVYCDGYVKIEEVIKNSPASMQGDLKENDIILKIKQENEKDYRDVFNRVHEDVLNLISGEKGTSVTLLVKHENASTQEISIIRDEVTDTSWYIPDDEYIYGVCDRNFKIILPFEYNSFDKNTNFNWELKNYIVSTKDGKYGILDTLFNAILPIKYDNIEALDNSYLVGFDGKYGVLDSNFKTIIPIEYDWIHGTHTDDDDNYKYIAKKDYVQKLYDEKGKIIQNFYIEDIEDGYAFETIRDEDGTLTSYIKYYLDGHYGVIDGENSVTIPAKYDKIEYLGNGNFVCTESNYSTILKDRK